MGQVSQDALRELEVDAYTAVMRALYAGTYDLVRESRALGVRCYAQLMLAMQFRKHRIDAQC